MSLKNKLVRAVPARFQTPWRYHYRRLTHRLERELSFLGEVLREPNTCVDVGANYGMYTRALTKLARRVVAFEPLPACADALEAHFGANVLVHRVALSARSGRVTLYTPIEGGRPNVERTGVTHTTEHSATIEVEARRLDEFGLEDVSFIKVDVEGHELEVLAGAADTIARDHPVLLVEIEQRHTQRPVADLIGSIEEIGYRGYFLDGAALRATTDFSYEKHQAPFLDGILAKGYINNFFFLPTR